VQPIDSVVNLHVSSGSLADVLAEALDAAKCVHQVRDSAEVVVVGVHPGMTQLGAYVHERGGKPVAILVNEMAAEPGG
jgi:arginine repressor